MGIRSLGHKPDPDRVIKDGMRVIHMACASGDLSRVKELVALGADVNAQDMDGWSPLHYACSIREMEVVMFLLSAGANHKLKNMNNTLPQEMLHDDDMEKALLSGAEAFELKERASLAESKIAEDSPSL